jgi:hypothetical protein
MSAAPERYRTTKYAPGPPQKRGSYQIDFLPSYIARLQWEAEMERRGVALTLKEGVTGRRLDDSVYTAGDKTAILPRDERHARDRTWSAYVDASKGKTPVIAIGGEGDHWQDLHEQVEDLRHYKQDVPAERERPDLLGEYIEEAERHESRRKGRITTSGTGHGPRYNANAKPDYSGTYRKDS